MLSPATERDFSDDVACNGAEDDDDEACHAALHRCFRQCYGSCQWHYL